MTSNGFNVISVERITAGPRAAVHLMQSSLSRDMLDGKPFLGRILGKIILRMLLSRRFWNNYLDKFFPEYAVVKSDFLPLSNSYVAVLIVAESK